MCILRATSQLAGHVALLFLSSGVLYEGSEFIILTFNCMSESMCLSLRLHIWMSARRTRHLFSRVKMPFALYDYYFSLVSRIYKVSASGRLLVLLLS